MLIGWEIAATAAFGEELDNAAWVFRTLHTFARQYGQVQSDNHKLNEAANDKTYAGATPPAPPSAA